MTKRCRIPLVLAALLLLIAGCSNRFTLRSPVYMGYRGEANQHSKLIMASKERLFSIITNHEQFPQLMPEHTIVSYEDAHPYHEGTIVRVYVDHVFKISWNSRVEEVVPNSMIRLVFLDGFFAGGTELWEFEDARGGTLVKQTIIVHPNGFFRQLVWNLKARLKHNLIVEELLDNLKLAVESETHGRRRTGDHVGR